jgi:hypothetical protein
MKITRKIGGKKTDRLELAAGASMTRLVDFKLSVLHAVRQDVMNMSRYAF